MEWIVARWLTFVATLVAAGSCAVALAILPRSVAAGDARDDLARSAARTGIIACLVMIPASLLRLADQVLALRSPGDPLRASLDALLGGTTWGTGFTWQSAALLLTLTALLLASRTVHPGRAWPWFVLAAVGAAGLCVTPAWQGHAIGTEEQTVLAVASDVAHVSGASLWLGTLLVLAWLGSAIPDGDGQVDPAAAARADARLRLLVPLVPPVALPGAALLVASGVLAGVLHLRGLSDLWETTWGRYVLAKAVLTTLVIGLGALNWRRLGPRLRELSGPKALRGALLVELGIALLILVVTAVLVVTPLPGE